MVGVIGTISRTSEISAQRVRPAMVKTRTRRISTGGAAGRSPGPAGPVITTASGDGSSGGLIMEAERGEGILGLRNGFALSDSSEKCFQVVGQG